MYYPTIYSEEIVLEHEQTCDLVRSTLVKVWDSIFGEGSADGTHVEQPQSPVANHNAISIASTPPQESLPPTSKDSPLDIVTPDAAKGQDVADGDRSHITVNSDAETSNLGIADLPFPDPPDEARVRLNFTVIGLDHGTASSTTAVASTTIAERAEDGEVATSTQPTTQPRTTSSPTSGLVEAQPGPSSLGTHSANTTVDGMASTEHSASPNANEGGTTTGKSTTGKSKTTKKNGSPPGRNPKKRPPASGKRPGRKKGRGKGKGKGKKGPLPLVPLEKTRWIEQSFIGPNGEDERIIQIGTREKKLATSLYEPELPPRPQKTTPALFNGCEGAR